MHTQLSCQQAKVMVFLAMAVDIVIRPLYGASAFGAQSAVPAIILIGLFTILVFTPLWQSKTSAIFTKSAFGKGFAALYCMLFLLSAANTLVRTEQFYRFISGKTLSSVVFVVLFLLTASFAIKTGLGALGRTADVILWLVVLSFTLIFLFNAKDMRLENLSYAPNPIQNIKNNFLQNLNFAPEILLFFVIFRGNFTEKQKGFTQVIFAVSLSFVLFTVFGELVMGSSATQVTQPAQTLARLGGVSVFKRLDAVHIAIWVLAAFLKLTAFIGAACMVSEALLADKRTRMVIGLCVTAAFSLLIYALPQPIVTAGLSIFTVLLAIASMLYAPATRGEYEKIV